MAAPTTATITGYSRDTGVEGDDITKDFSVLLSGTALSGERVFVTRNFTLNTIGNADENGDWSFAIFLRPGLNELNVYTKDADGIESALSETLTVTYDDIAPDAPVITGFTDDTGAVGDNITTDRTPTLTGTSEPNATIEILNYAGTVTADASGNWSFTIPELADADMRYSFIARATDVAGNESAFSNSLEVTVISPDQPPLSAIDLAADKDLGDSDTDNLTARSTPAVLFTATAGSALEVDWDDGRGFQSVGTGTGVPQRVTIDEAYPRKIEVEKTIQVRATFEGESTTESLTITYDAVRPFLEYTLAPESLRGDGNSITNDVTPSYAGTAEPGREVTLEWLPFGNFADLQVVGSTFADSDGNFTVTSSAEFQEGLHKTEVRVSDEAGNTFIRQLFLTIDTTAPDAPTFFDSINSDSGVEGDRITNSSTIFVSGTAEADSTVRIYDGETQVGAKASPSGFFSIRLDSMTDGDYLLRATATDLAGNVSVLSDALSMTIDRTSPENPVITGFSEDTQVDGDNITSDTTLRLTGTAEADATVYIFDGLFRVGEVMADGFGDWSYTSPELADDTYDFTARAVDVANNGSFASNTLSVTIDTAAPDAPVITGFSDDTGVEGDGITQFGIIDVSGTAESGAQIFISGGFTVPSGVTADENGDWSISVTLQNGSNELSAVAQDAAGNRSAPSETLAVTVDFDRPDAPVITGFSDDTGTADDGITADTTPTLTGTAEAGLTVEVRRNGTLVDTLTADEFGDWSFTSEELTDGNYLFYAHTIDIAGNQSLRDSAVRIIIDSAPPDAPTLDLAAVSDSGRADDDDVTRVTELVLQGVAEGNSTVEVFDGTTSLGTTTAAEDGAWTLTTGTLSEGVKNLTATATDGGDRTSAASTPLSVTIDTTAPEVGRYLVDTYSSGGLSAVAGDFTGDGATDLFLTNSSGEISLGLFDISNFAAQDAAGTVDGLAESTTAALGGYVFPEKLTHVSYAGLVIVNVGDQDGDGKDDFLLNLNTNSGITGETEGGSANSEFVLVYSSTLENLDVADGFDDNSIQLDVLRASDDTVVINTLTQFSDATNSSVSQTDILGDAGSELVFAGGAYGNTEGAAYIVDVDALAALEAATTSTSGAIRAPQLSVPGQAYTLTNSGNLDTGNSLATNGSVLAVGSKDILIGSYGELNLVSGLQLAAADALDGSVDGAIDLELTGAQSYGVTFTSADAGLGTSGRFLSDIDGDDRNELLLTTIGSAQRKMFIVTSTALDGFAAGVDIDLDTLSAGTGIFEIVGTSVNSSYGFNFVDIGDTDGDGVADLLITPNLQNTVAGMAYLLSGANLADYDALDGTVDNVISLLDLEGNSGAYHFLPGQSLFTNANEVAALGDIDGDGRDDFTLSQAGATFIVRSGNLDAMDRADGTQDGRIDFATVSGARGDAIELEAASDTGIKSDGITTDTTPTLTGVTDADATVEIFRDGSSVGTVTADDLGEWSFTSAELAEGSHTFTIQATDAADNTSAMSAGFDVVVDTTAPTQSPVVIDFQGGEKPDAFPGHSDVINDADSVTASGTAQPGAIIVSSIITDLEDRSNGLAGPTTVADGDGNWTINFGDGVVTKYGLDNLVTYYARFSVADAAGNIGPDIDTFSNAEETNLAIFYVDTVTPAAPVITGFGDDTEATGDGFTIDTTPTLSGTTDAGYLTGTMTVEIYRDGVSVGSVSPDVTGQWSFTSEELATDASYTFTAQAIDFANNTSGISTDFDVTIQQQTATPVFTVLDSDTGFSRDDGITNDQTLKLDGTADPDSSVEVFMNGVSVGLASVDGFGSFSMDLRGTTLPEGDYAFTAVATAPGNGASAPSAPFDVTIDTTAPTEIPVVTGISQDTGIDGDFVTGDDTLTFTGTATPGTTVSVNVTVPGGSYGGITGVTDAAGNWSIPYTVMLGAEPGMEDGTYSVVANVLDLAGNSGPDSVVVPFTIDTVAPDAPSITGFSDDTGTAGDGITSDKTVTLNGTAEADAKVDIFRDGSSVGTATADGSGDWSFTSTSLDDGPYSFTATASDLAGNTSTASESLTITILTQQTNAPVITGISEDSGAIDGVTNDTSLIVSGTAPSNADVTLFYNGIAVTTVSANEGGVWVADLTSGGPFADGSFNFTAIAQSSGELASAPSEAFAVVVDTVAPAAPVITSYIGDSGTVGDGVTSDTTLTLSGTGEFESIVDVFDGATLLGTTVVGLTGWSFETPELRDGVANLTAVARDVAGNASAASNVLSVTIDTVNLDVPTITGISPDTGIDGDAITSDGQIVISGTGPAGETVSVTLVTPGRGIFRNVSVDEFGNWSYDFSDDITIADGTARAFAQSIDAAGNVSDTTDPFIFTVDSQAPALPDVTFASTPRAIIESGFATSDTTPTLNFSGLETDTVLSISVAGALTPFTSVTALPDGTASYTFESPLSGNDNSFAFTVTDLAGNSTTSPTPYRILIDEAAILKDPTLANDTGANNSDGITSDPTLQIVVEHLNTLQFFDSDGLVHTETANFGENAPYNVEAPFDFTLDGLADGTHDLFVVATDYIGNFTAPIDIPTFTLDTQIAAPSIDLAATSDTGTSSTDDVTGDTTPTLQGIAEVNAVVEIFSGATSLGSVGADSSGAWSFTTSALSSGDHTFSAIATDLAGNVSEASAPLVVTIETDRPATPTINLASESDSGRSDSDDITKDSIVTLDGTATPNTTVELILNDVLVATVPVGADGLWQKDDVASVAGPQQFQAVGVNAAGIRSDAATLDVTFDKIAPAIATINLDAASDTGVSDTDNLTSDQTLELSGTAEADALVEIFDIGTSLGTALADESGAWTFTTPSLSVDIHSLRAIATDVAGNAASPSDKLLVRVDTTVPNPPTVELPVDTNVGFFDNITNDDTPTLQGLAVANSSVEIFKDGLSLAIVDTLSDGRWSYTPATLSDGEHDFEVVAFSETGVRSQPGTLTVTVDTVAPVVPTIGLDVASDSGVSFKDGLTNDTTPTFSGTAEAGNLVELLVGTTVITAAIADEFGAWSLTTRPLEDGAYAITVRATDLAGNATSSAPLALNVDTVAPVGVPTISGVTPDTGVSATDNILNATDLTISGTATPNANVRVIDRTDQAQSFVDTQADANGDWSFVTSDLSEGYKAFEAREFDDAGNLGGASAPLYFTIDLGIPDAPVILGFSEDTGTVGDFITNDDTPTLNGTAESRSSVEVFSNGVSVGTTTADISGAWSLTTTSLSAAQASLTAVATDAAGNVSGQSAALVLTIDNATVAPTITLDAVSDTGVLDGITADATPSFSGTAEAGARVAILDLQGGESVLGTVFADGAGAWSFTAPTLSNGPHAIGVRATDISGNVSQVAGPVIIVDTAAPAVPVITGINADTGVAGDFVTADANPLISGTGEPGATITLFVEGVSSSSTQVDAAGNWQIAVSGGAISDGTYSFSATASDAAGNVSALSATRAVTIDTMIVDPTLELNMWSDSGVADDGVTSNTTPRFDGTAEAGALVQLFSGTVEVGSAFANELGNWNVTASTLAEGQSVISVVASDLAGNTATTQPVALTIDTLAPDAPSIVSFADDTGVQGDGITSDTAPRLSGTAESGAFVSILRDGVYLGGVTANASGVWNISDTMAEGSYTFTATARDAAGNVSIESSAFDLTIDATAPTVPLIQALTDDTGVAGDGITSDTTPTLSGVAEAGATVTILRDGSEVGSTTADASGAWSFTSATLADGSYAFSAFANDVAGNGSAVSSVFAVSVDTTAPVAPVIISISNDSGVAGDGITSDATPTLSGTAEAGASIGLYDGETLVGTTVADANGLWTVTTTELDEGDHSFTIEAVDLAGNGNVSETLSVTVDTIAPAAPTIASISTDTGSAEDGITSDTTLTLSGTGPANETVTVLRGGVAIGVAVINSGGQWSFDVAALADDYYAFTAFAMDAAGNMSSISAEFAVTVDTLAPSTLFLDNDSIDENAEGNTVVGLVQSSEPAILTLIDDAGGRFVLNGNVLLVAEGAVLDYEEQPSRDVTVQAVDVAGNVTTTTLTVQLNDTAEIFGGGPGAGDEVIYGDAGDNDINAAEGNDTVFGGAGDDTLDGGTGDDSLTGGDGDDAMAGGSGNDTMDGSAGDDLLYMINGDNILFGGEGDDIMIGGYNTDEISGGVGNDIMRGDISTFLYGNDTLRGGEGDDLLEGGGGSDQFIFSTNDGNDTIGTLAINTANRSASTVTGADFDSGVDLIVLEGFGYLNAADAFSHVSDVSGIATFSDQGTTITFSGLTAADLSVDDFVLGNDDFMLTDNVLNT